MEKYLEITKLERYLGVEKIFEDNIHGYSYFGHEYEEEFDIGCDLFWTITFKQARNKDIENIKNLASLMGYDVFKYDSIKSFLIMCEKNIYFSSFYNKVMDCYYDGASEHIELIHKGLDSIIKLVIPYENITEHRHLCQWALEKYCEQMFKIATNNEKESTYQKGIIKNFNKIFPEYEYTSQFNKINGMGNLDILARDKKSNRDVIMELKTDTKNPNKQLVAYAYGFENPILVAVTTIPVTNKIGNIIYKVIPFKDVV